MLTSLALIFLTGLTLGTLSKKLKLPKIVGMLFAGILLGPFVLDLLDPSILAISTDLRQIALIVILLKAGFSLDLNDLKKVGRPAILLAFLPATFEILAYVVFAPIILNISTLDAALMGSVLAAVSPAVVVPKMVSLIDNKYGTKKGIPQMILAGASCDDIFVIVLFTTFLSIAQGGHASIYGFLNIPISIILGVSLGLVFGYILHLFFENLYKKGNYIRNSLKVIIILAVAFLLISIENWLENSIAVSGLLAVISMASILKLKSYPEVSFRISEKFGKIWLAAEIILFVLVGSAVDIRYTLQAGLGAVLIIFIALAFRSFAVIISTAKTNLTLKERLFTVIAYLPKATVQAAIGSIPLTSGLASGNIILSVAVLSILITAPLGALGMDLTYNKFLDKN